MKWCCFNSYFQQTQFQTAHTEGSCIAEQVIINIGFDKLSSSEKCLTEIEVAFS